MWWKVERTTTWCCWICGRWRRKAPWWRRFWKKWALRWTRTRVLETRVHCVQVGYDSELQLWLRVDWLNRTWRKWLSSFTRVCIVIICTWQSLVTLFLNNESNSELMCNQTLLLNVDSAVIHQCAAEWMEVSIALQMNWHCLFVPRLIVTTLNLHLWNSFLLLDQSNVCCRLGSVLTPQISEHTHTPF